MNKFIGEKVIRKILEEVILKNGQPALSLYSDHLYMYFQSSEKFIIGGPQDDVGFLLDERSSSIRTAGGAHTAVEAEGFAAYTCRQIAMSVVKLAMLTCMDEKSASIRLTAGVRTEADRLAAYILKQMAESVEELFDQTLSGGGGQVRCLHLHTDGQAALGGIFRTPSPGR